jgi:exopolyphosphatase/guanosine-5'-triphosphate,3'-diphosphate pyrophosphatase
MQFGKASLQAQMRGDGSCALRDRGQEADMEDTSAGVELGDCTTEGILQDARLAVRLFDLTGDLHHLDDEHRDLLYCAGLLHDIGYAEGYAGHHKTAYRLIMAGDLPGLSERETRIVANVARYHRGSQPAVSHEGFAALDARSGNSDHAGGHPAAGRRPDRTHRDAVRRLAVGGTATCWSYG